MTGRTVLGPADVSDEELLGIIGVQLGFPASSLQLLRSAAETFPYDLETITTAGRYWVSGSVLTPDGPRDFRCFVKHVQCFSRSPLFAQVPEQHRAQVAEMVPWRTEGLVYGSDLADRLPDGFRMPRVLAVRDLDALSSAIWLEEVPVVEHRWEGEDFARAAFLFGRLAASPGISQLADIDPTSRYRTARTYVEGRLAVQIAPLLHGSEIWHHPLVAAAFDDRLRDRLRRAVDRAEDYADELEKLPTGTAHGDACPNNLLRVADSADIILIDFGFWSRQPIGFDLAQLLIGEVQLGRRSATTLAETQRACLAAYVCGLRAEGSEIPAATVQRSHALQLLIYSGLSAIPFDLLQRPVTPQTVELARARAAIATFALDLVDNTAPTTTDEGARS